MSRTAAATASIRHLKQSQAERDGQQDRLARGGQPREGGGVGIDRERWGVGEAEAGRMAADILDLFIAGITAPAAAEAKV